VGAAGVDFDNGVARTPAAGQSIDAQMVDTATGDTYWVQHINTNATAGTAVTVSDTAPTTDRWDLEAVEIKPASGPPPTTTTTGSTTTTTSATTTTTIAPGSGPKVDPSTPAACTIQNNVSSTSCGTFSPPAGTVIYAMFSVDSPAGVPGAGVAYDPNNAGCQPGITNSGTALCWHRVINENGTNSVVGGFVDVWWASNSGAQTGIQVTANFAQPTKNVPPPVGLFRVVVMNGAAANQSTAPAAANANISSTLTNTASATVQAPAKAQVFGLFDAWNSVPDPQSVAAGQVLDGQVINNTDVDSYWDQLLTAPTTTAGPVSISATLAANDNWHAVAWAVLPA
jgi:hypothetical protein